MSKRLTWACKLTLNQLAQLRMRIYIYRNYFKLVMSDRQNDLECKLLHVLDAVKDVDKWLLDR